MDTTKLSKNIKLYYWFEIFSEPLFIGSILLYYLEQVSGLSLSALYYREALCLLIFVFWEIPSGAIADSFGRRKTILVGRLLFPAWGILLAIATTPLEVWLANILWAIGQPLVSGADSALLYDSLKALGRENEFKKIVGRAKSYRFVAAALTTLAAGFLTTINLRLGPWLSVLFLLPNLVAAFLFTEPPRFDNPQPAEPELEAKLTFCGYWRLIVESLVFTKNNLIFKWLIGYSVVLAVASKLWFFAYNDYFALVKLPLPWYGIIFFLLNIVAAISSHSAHWLEKRLGERGSIIALPLFISLPLLAMGSFVILPFAFLTLSQNVVRGYSEPFLDHFLHRHLDSKHRATLYSVRSAVVALSISIGLALFG